jgi:peptide/nickel transport system substrate-binding protein
MGGPAAVLGLTNDGLVSFDHRAGPGAARLVPDLAVSLPLPSDAGRTYVFRLRPGIRYSNGATVRAGDVRHSLERVFALRSPGMSFFDRIAGASACRTAVHCDLSRGIVTNDRAGTVTFHLIAPDPDFVQKLAQPYAYALPATTPVEEAHSPLPATGPYVVRDSPAEVRYDRNPRFREWSGAAQPQGYPDHIVWPKGLSASRATTLVERGEADLNINIGPAPRGHRRVLSTRFAGQLRVNPWLGTAFFFLNVRAKPFDDVRVRRALNFALDRRRMVEIYGGRQAAQPTCQLLPPQMPGFERYCPYTRDRHHPRRRRRRPTPPPGLEPGTCGLEDRSHLADAGRHPDVA